MDTLRKQVEDIKDGLASGTVEFKKWEDIKEEIEKKHSAKKETANDKANGTSV